LHPFSKFSKSCWKIYALSSSLCGKISRSIQGVLIFWNPFKVHDFNWSSPKCILMLATLEACISLIHCLFSIKICQITFPMKPSYCNKIFMSIQVVLNVWDQFKVQNPNIFGLQWILATCFFFIQCLFPINKKLGKMCILV